MKKIFYSLITILLVGVWGCQEFLDINEDPNNPTETTPALLLPNIELNIVNSVGMGTSGLSSYLSVYMHQTTRRSTFDAYNSNGTDFALQAAWSQFYSQGLQDIEELLAIAEADGSPHYYGVGLILKSFSYSILVDIWGDVPFMEANDFPAVLYPTLSNDDQVYPQILEMLDTGIDSIAVESSLQSPGTEDLIYGGDLDNWRKFAKTLKLKLLNQTRLSSDVSAQIDQLLSEDDLIGDQDDDFELEYGTSQSPENRHPGFIADYTAARRINYISIWFYEILSGQSANIYNSIQDPRLPYYFFNQLNGNDPENPPEYLDGDFLSIYFGSSGPNQAGQQDNSQTLIGLYPYGGAYDDGNGGAADQDNGSGAVAQRILTYTDRLFIEAELALTGVIMADDSAKFHQAVIAAFDKLQEIVDYENGFGAQSVPDPDEDDITDYINGVVALYDQASDERKLEMIMTQKWIASFGYAVDTYTDYRRTGYPVLYDPDTDNLPFTNSLGPFPNSLPYPQREIELNSLNISQKVDLAAEKVFWDVD